MAQFELEPPGSSGYRIANLLLAIAVLVGVLFAAGNSDSIAVNFWRWGTAQLPAYMLFAGGFVAGALAMVLFVSVLEPTTSARWIYTAIFCAAIMAAAAGHAGEMSFGSAALIILMGSAALIATASAIARFTRGEAIEVQSHWGGLGSGLGGWRLSPAASLLLLALALGSSAIAIGLAGKSSPTTGKVTAPAVGSPPATMDRPAAPSAEQTPGAGAAKPAETSKQIP